MQAVSIEHHHEGNDVSFSLLFSLSPSFLSLFSLLLLACLCQSCPVSLSLLQCASSAVDHE